MKLPNVENAQIPESKINQYLLNLQHPKGRSKAKFLLQMGFTLADWQILVQALLSHAKAHDVSKVEKTKFGTRYVIEGVLDTPIEKTPKVRVVWFISIDDTLPRLVTAYPLEADDD